MMGQKDNSERTQIEFISLEDLVPKNHLVRKLTPLWISLLSMMR